MYLVRSSLRSWSRIKQPLPRKSSPPLRPVQLLVPITATHFPRPVGTMVRKASMKLPEDFVDFLNDAVPSGKASDVLSFARL